MIKLFSKLRGTLEVRLEPSKGSGTWALRLNFSRYVHRLSALPLRRVVTLFKSDDPNPFNMMGLHIETYPAAYAALVKGESITSAATDVVLEAAPPPSVVILDVCPSFVNSPYQAHSHFPLRR
jgi:hypothetical protein